ncbi:hypothetical protein [Pseudoxanthomonas sp. PXM02]|uniref:hypothetical protein n=1 Tax=Pseudoxanthomonas sp. PXM02 TaxID=2769294 RepID=UPI00177F89D1|nr:hypothetical protein [Pseudoxanthomonas sp. PXM02]MBD9478381.1 hypothetical protein [Pseudoxanthomonas sp. PXM02]
MRLLTLAACGLLGLMPYQANAQLAMSSEDAQRFLSQMLQSRTIAFTIGNDLNDRETFGLVASTTAVATSYNKKFLRGWSEHSSFRKPVHAQFDFTDFGHVGKEEKYDDCSTSVTVNVTGAKNTDYSFTFPADGLTKERVYSEDSKWVYNLEGDPRIRFGGPYRIDWRIATFQRSKRQWIGLTDFLIKTDQRAPYALISVNNEDLADYVENALRVLQLSCQP